MKFRQSLLGEADKCLKSLQYSIQGPPDGIKGSGISRELGTGYHAGLELFYDDVKEGTVKVPSDIRWRLYLAKAKQDMEESIARVPQEHFIWSEKIPDLNRAIEILEVMLHSYFDNANYWPVLGDTPEEERWIVLDTEFTFSYQDQSLNSRVTGEIGERAGTADLVLVSADTMTLVVCDHKTAGRAWDRNKHHPRKSNQAPWYIAAMKWMCEDKTPFDHYRFCFDIMTYTGKFERRISDPDERHIEAIGQKAVALRKVLDIIDQGFDLPANPASTLCSPLYCDHWRYCPHGKAAE